MHIKPISAQLVKSGHCILTCLIVLNREREAIEEEHQRQSGQALLDSQAQGTATSGHSSGENDGGAQGSLVALEQTQASGHGASNGTRTSGDIGKLAIVDCRSVATVWGNSFKGGGTEDEGGSSSSVL